MGRMRGERQRRKWMKQSGTHGRQVVWNRPFELELPSCFDRRLPTHDTPNRMDLRPGAQNSAAMRPADRGRRDRPKTCRDPVRGKAGHVDTKQRHLLTRPDGRQSADIRRTEAHSAGLPERNGAIRFGARNWLNLLRELTTRKGNEAAIRCDGVGGGPRSEGPI